jgi:hypothetical protein
MCIAIINTSEGNVISKKTFQQCWNNNTHGAGISAVINGKIVVDKELKDWERLYDVYAKWREDKSLNIMLHFRISTHGSRNLDNCHPFMVNKGLVFCHNGIIGQVDTSNDKSDTVAFNEQYLKSLPNGFAFNPAIKQLLLDRIGYSKLVFLTSENKYSIVGEKRGLWDGGNWYSNDSYKPSAWIDYGGIKVAKKNFNTPKTEAKTDKVIQPEIFVDDSYDDWFGYSKSWSKGKSKEKICFECNSELVGHLEKHYGYCDSCLKEYGVLPSKDVLF